LGFASLIWVLIRVIPKPSRATYPCMKVAAPLATSFVLYISGVISSMLFFKKARKFFLESRYLLFSLMLIAGVIFGLTSYMQKDNKVYANLQTTQLEPNQPIGTARGVNPGRVVWIHNPNATNEDCANTENHYWYQDDNTNQDVVDNMVSKGLQMLTGAADDTAAWDSLFHYFNQEHGKGDVGYTAGEKFVIKINLNGLGNGGWWNPADPNINTSPQVCYAVLNQLINVVGAAQSDIGIGDPNFNFDTPHWNKCHTAFPDVVYWGPDGSGRTAVTQSAEYAWIASDGRSQDYLPQEYIDAAYMINLPVFKKHHRAGISISSKNHFGSITPFAGSAFHVHYSLPCPEGGADVTNGEYGVYRCFVDIMGHKDLGGKTILHLVDGLWSSINWGHPSIKWAMPPFDNDYPNSLFLSQDPVAVQSVCYDFLFYEFDTDHPQEGAYDPGDNHGPFPQYAGTDDFLRQAADSSNWPEDTQYDPEGDGTLLPRSLGVYEHWNNAVDKQYTRNLETGDGIELVYNFSTSGIIDNQEELRAMIKSFSLDQNFPNPFNASTTIGFNLSVDSRISLEIYNIRGQRIRTVLNDYRSAGQYIERWNGKMDNGMEAPSGVYFYKMSIQNDGQSHEKIKKMVLNK
jgi:hypothetical protein